MTRQSKAGLAQGADVTSFLERILTEGIKPHADAIARIGEAGKIAGVVFELHRGVPEDAARRLGWDGVRSTFTISRATARRTIAHADQVTAAWVEQRTPGRTQIFLMVHAGTLLVNHDLGQGFSLEPYSTRGAWLS